MTDYRILGILNFLLSILDQIGTILIAALSVIMNFMVAITVDTSHGVADAVGITNLLGRSGV